MSKSVKKEILASEYSSKQVLAVNTSRYSGQINGASNIHFKGSKCSNLKINVGHIFFWYTHRILEKHFFLDTFNPLKPFKVLVHTSVDSEYLLTRVLTREYLFFDTLQFTRVRFVFINNTRASRVLNS